MVNWLAAFRSKMCSMNLYLPAVLTSCGVRRFPLSVADALLNALMDVMKVSFVLDSPTAVVDS